MNFLYIYFRCDLLPGCEDESSDLCSYGSTSTTIRTMDSIQSSSSTTSSSPNTTIITVVLCIIFVVVVMCLVFILMKKKRPSRQIQSHASRHDIIVNPCFEP